MQSHTKRQPCRSTPGAPHGLPLFLWMPLLACAALALLLFTGTTQAQVLEPSGLAAAVAVEEVLIDTIARTEKSIVAIATLNSNAGQNPGIAALRPDPFDRFRQESATQPSDPDFVPNEYGAGVVVDGRGLILTQHHVLEAGDQYWVTTWERKTYPAKIRGADPRSGLAILEIEANDLVPITFGDASQLRKGQIVIALGNPYAIARDGQASASWGIVSNLARKAGQAPSGDRAARKPSLHHFGTLIQTDAKLNFGASGGALVNLRGEMVGLTTSIAATAGFETAAGYAVPIDNAFRRVIDTLKEGREVEYGLLGVEPENLQPSEIRQGRKGLRVRDVWDGTPAARVGLLPGDIITHVNEEPVFDADSLVLQVGKLPASAEVELNFLRNDQPRKLAVRLAKYPVRGEMVVTNRPAPWRGVTVDYPTALPSETYRSHARMGDIDFDGCVVLTAVAQDSPAWKAGLRPNMFLSHVNSVRVHDPAEFYAAVADLTGEVPVRLTLPADQQPVRAIAE